MYFGRERSARIHSHLQSVAGSVGLTMKTRDVIINSRRALAAAELARERDLYEPMHQALFKAHWEGTGRLEDLDDLARIGEGVGLDGDELRDAVETGRYDPVIDENRRLASSAGIDAIPAHVFGRRYLVLGAQPYAVFKQVVEKIAAES